MDSPARCPPNLQLPYPWTLSVSQLIPGKWAIYNTLTPICMHHNRFWMLIPGVARVPSVHTTIVTASSPHLAVRVPGPVLEFRISLQSLPILLLLFPHMVHPLDMYMLNYYQGTQSVCVSSHLNSFHGHRVSTSFSIYHPSLALHPTLLLVLLFVMNKHKVVKVG